MAGFQQQQQATKEELQKVKEFAEEKSILNEIDPLISEWNVQLNLLWKNKTEDLQDLDRQMTNDQKMAGKSPSHVTQQSALETSKKKKKPISFASFTNERKLKRQSNTATLTWF